MGRLQRNNFDLLRFGLAAIVVFVHVSDLSALPELRWIAAVLSSKMAVNAFFVVSGFLVFMSYDKSTTLARYAEKRARRLYPAYFVAIMLGALLLVTVSTTPSAYFGWAWVKYVAANLLFLNFLAPTLPGVFESNAFQAVNGALWTLKVEVMFYFSVPLIAWLFRFGRARVLVSIYALSVVYALTMERLGRPTAAVQLPGALSFFVAGAGVYYYLPLFEAKVKALVTVAVAVLLAGHFLPLGALYPAALGVVVCFLALFGYAGNFGRYGDFSYGLYIVHFPIIQTLIHSGLFKEHPYAATALSAGLAFIGAVLMWHLIEKRFLARSSHYVQATVETPSAALVSR